MLEMDLFANADCFKNGTVLFYTVSYDILDIQLFHILANIL